MTSLLKAASFAGILVVALTFNSVGAEGVGKLSIVGIAAIITGAIHHAVGRRLRALPIRIERRR
jgi:CO/xanthine dehydrogenase Mo-binding subunit